MAQPLIKDYEKDTTLELCNVSMSSAVTSLAGFINKSIRVQPPALDVYTIGQFQDKYLEKGILSTIPFVAELQGQQFFFLKEHDALLLATLLMGGSPEQLPAEPGEMELSAISEAVSMLTGAFVTTLAGFTGSTLEVGVPSSLQSSLKEFDFAALGIEKEELWAMIHYGLEVEPDLNLILLQAIPLKLLREIIAPLLIDMIQEEDQAPLADPAADWMVEETPEDLTEMEKDAMAEVGNISLGSAATALSQLVNRRVQITTPRVFLTTMGEVKAKYPAPCLVVSVSYFKGLQGNNVFIVKEEDALVISGLMMGMEPPEKPALLGEIELSAVSEAMNQMMGSSATAMSDLLDRLIDITPPQLKRVNLGAGELDELDVDTVLVQIAFRMEVGDLIDSEILQLIPLEFAKEMSSHLLSMLSGETEPFFIEEEEEEEDEVEEVKEKAVFIDEVVQTVVQEKEETKPLQGTFSSYGLEKDEYQRLKLIRDIPLEISAVLGSTRLPLKVVTSLSPGDTIDLDRYVGEPVDLFANDQLVAQGEVVLFNGQFGIRITSLLHPNS